jgi:hypothetical protein
MAQHEEVIVGLLAFERMESQQNCRYNISFSASGCTPGARGGTRFTARGAETGTKRTHQTNPRQGLIGWKTHMI